VLVDLRNHGKTLTVRQNIPVIALVEVFVLGSSSGFAGPHTLSACVNDVIALANHLHTPIDGIIGHSLGGKIAVQMLNQNPTSPPCPRLHALPTPHKHDAAPPRHPNQQRKDNKVKFVILDALPGTWDQAGGDSDADGVLKVMAFLESTPLPIPDRRWLKQALHQAGFTPIAVE
jgi:pimeloyl-ACP methyl ester carboxylesterase